MVFKAHSVASALLLEIFSRNPGSTEGDANKHFHQNSNPLILSVLFSKDPGSWNFSWSSWIWDTCIHECKICIYIFCYLHVRCKTQALWNGNAWIKALAGEPWKDRILHVLHGVQNHPNINRASEVYSHQMLPQNSRSQSYANYSRPLPHATHSRKAPKPKSVSSFFFSSSFFLAALAACNTVLWYGSPLSSNINGMLGWSDLICMICFAAFLASASAWAFSASSFFLASAAFLFFSAASSASASARAFWHGPTWWYYMRIPLIFTFHSQHLANLTFPAFPS